MLLRLVQWGSQRSKNFWPLLAKSRTYQHPLPLAAHPKDITMEGNLCILREQLVQSACKTLIGNRLFFTFQLCFWRCVRTSSFLDGLIIPDEGAGVWGRPLVFITKMFPLPHWCLLASPQHADNLIFQKHPPALP